MSKTKDGDQKRKAPIVPALFIAVGLLGGGYFMGGGKSSSAQAAAPAGATAAARPAPPKAEPPGPIVQLDSITMNLADGRFLKMRLALQLAKTAKSDEIDHESAKALDAAISYFGARSYQDLLQPGARDAARDELSKRVAELYDKKVTGVYFTELVMQ